jgi:dTMP kinase
VRGLTDPASSGQERVIEGQHEVDPAVAGLGDHRRSAYRNLLRSRNYRLYFSACLTSSLGDWTGFVALQALVSSLYAGNPRFALFGLGGVMMARLLPSLLIGPVSGVLADRYDRKRLMVVVDLLRGTLFVFVAFSRSITTLFVLTFAVECVSLLYLAAKDATLPRLVAKRDLTEANQLNLLLAYGTLPAGAVIVTVITTVLVAGGFEPRDATVAALLVDAATFFVGAALMSRLRVPPRAVRHEPTEEPPGVIEELREGLRFIRDLPIIRSLIVGVVGVFFGAGVVVAVGPEFVRSSLGRPPTEWSRLVTAVGLGLIAGILLAPLASRRIRKERLFPLALATTGAMAAGMSFLPSFPPALALGALLGVFAGLSFVFGYTLIQEYTNDEVRARTFAAFYTSTRIALFSALGIAPFFAGAISGSVFINGNFLRLSGIRITIFLGGMVALYSSLGAMRGMFRALREEPPKTGVQITTRSPVRTGGLFIAFEGVEGSGKSTQVGSLVATLQEEGLDVVVTREPGGPPVAERIRDLLLDPNAEGMDPRTEALLYAAARAEHVRRVVAPGLEAGKVVVCDRFIDSSLAYQGFARELGDSDVLEINRWAVAGVIPDVVVLLDLDADEGLRRVRDRALQRSRSRPDDTRPLRLTEAWREQGASDRLEAENPEFHRRVAAGYRELARRDRGRFVIVDASADAATIARQIRVALHPWLSLPERPAAEATPDSEAGSA